MHDRTLPDALAQLRAYGKYYPCAAVHDAVAEIERLRARVAELEEQVAGIGDEMRAAAERSDAG